MKNAAYVVKKIKHLKFYDELRELKISPEVLREFKKFEQKNKDLEAGGILLGYVYSVFDEIANITIPNKWDKRERLSFIRAKKPAQKNINQSWAKSKGILTYLGEWHTHSEENPTPSAKDRNMISEQFRNNLICTNYLYLIIVGQNKTLWVGRQSSYGLVEMNIVK